VVANGVPEVPNAGKVGFMARPTKPIDPAMVEKLACSGCSSEQIGAILDCNERTIQRRFATILKRGRERRNGRLQIELFRRAMKGSDAIAIFLAKNWLGMTDRPDVVVNVQQNAIGEAIPAERLSRYGELMLQIAQEDREAAKVVALPEGSDIIS
jgi:hypothetical protein